MQRHLRRLRRMIVTYRVYLLTAPDGELTDQEVRDRDRLRAEEDAIDAAEVQAFFASPWAAQEHPLKDLA